MSAQRRFLLYFSWNMQHEANRPLGQLDERFPALFELRRAAWPHFEWLKNGPQGIDAFLDRIVLGDFERFCAVVEEESGTRPTVVSSCEADGVTHALQSVLDDTVDTCVIISLDHVESDQAPDDADIASVLRFLERPGSVLAVCPHHYIGGGESAEGLDAEHRHHGDALVPARQRLGGYARQLLDALEMPVVNLYGLRPATMADGEPAALDLLPEHDELHLLGGAGQLAVTTFNAHGHLPHLQPADSSTAYRVLARQRIAAEVPPHPYTDTGATHFNALLWAPPSGSRQGQVLVCDATLWSAAFKGLASLENFWRNLATMPLAPPNTGSHDLAQSNAGGGQTLDRTP